MAEPRVALPPDDEIWIPLEIAKRMSLKRKQGRYAPRCLQFLRLDVTVRQTDVAEKRSK